MGVSFTTNIPLYMVWKVQERGRGLASFTVCQVADLIAARQFWSVEQGRGEGLSVAGQVAELQERE